jgi:hypothetical protein
MITKFFRTDEETDTVNALKVFCIFREKIKEDEYYLKWAIIALHNALQGFMVLALRGTNSLLVYSEDSFKKWMKAYEKDEPVEDRLWMDSFKNLYKKIKSDNMINLDTSKRFIATSSQDYSIMKINELRKDFIHFFPKNWSIEISGIDKVFQDCLNIVSFLVNECGNILWKNESLEKDVKAIINNLSKD